MLETVWKFPTPEHPTHFDRMAYRAGRCKGAWWHPSLLLREAEVTALRDALKSAEGKAWLKAKGEREAALTMALLSSFMRRSMENPRPALKRREALPPIPSPRPMDGAKGSGPVRQLRRDLARGKPDALRRLKLIPCL